MRLLILGGTRFVGRHIAAAALERGWEVSLFNRGREDPDAFPAAEHLIGDRDGGLAALERGRWDAVVDTSGYDPRLVRASAELLHNRVARYVFISSVSVYADPSQLGITESARLVQAAEPEGDDVEAGYGALKARCEQAVEEVMGPRATIVRPGLIVGPHDPTNRFTYWVTRIAAGGDVLAPEPADQPVQVIDVRDLAAWLLRLAADDVGGVFNAVGDVSSLDVVLQTIVDATGADARLRWTAEERLLGAGVKPWQDVPLWLGADPASAGFMAMSGARAKRAGLQLRPLADTVGDTLAWARQEPQPKGGAGLDPETERRLLVH